MSRNSSATINYTLTAYAQGLSNDIMEARAIFTALCPRVQVSGSAGQFKKFDDKNSFSVYSTSRGLGGSARRILFEATDGTFDCKPQALEVTVDMEERNRAGQSDALAMELLDQGKIKALVNSTTLSHLKKVVDFVGSNTTAVADRGNWSNANIDPIDQLDEQLETLATRCGSKSNISLTLGLSAWRALRNHPKVKARASGVKVGGITIEDLKTLLMFPVDVVTGVVSYDTTKEGQTASKAQVLGSIAYLCYSVPNPTLYDPSPFKCFTTGTGNIESVRTYQDPSGRFDVHAVDWSEDLESTSTQSIIRLDIA